MGLSVRFFPFHEVTPTGDCQASRGVVALGLCVSARPARLLRHVSPIAWDNVILYGQCVLDHARIRWKRGPRRAFWRTVSLATRSTGKTPG